MTGTRADLVFGSNSELRAVAEVYGSADAQAGQNLQQSALHRADEVINLIWCK